ncbi:MAG: CDP-alcohol phosphatidyltransferase family protein [Vicinamibacterales bacterium]
MTPLSSPWRAFHRANVLTYASLCTAIGAIAYAAAGRAAEAGACIAMAVMADTFDGRFARMFERNAVQRALGVHLDSLSDAIAFGFAPVVCAALLTAGPDHWTPMLLTFWWTSAAAYAACAITRLAFYNLMHEDSTGFVGLPVPVAALVWATAVLLAPGPAASTALFATTAAAMVLPLPIPRPTGFGLAAFACWPMVVVVLNVVRG